MCKRLSLVLILSAIIATGCKGDKHGTKRGAAVAEATSEQAAAPSSPEPVSPPSSREPASAEPATAALPLHAPDDSWPLPDREPQFIGFSSDGSLYAVRESFGHEEEPGFAPFWVEFIELRDVQSQRVVRAYQGEPFSDENWGNEVRPDGAEERKAQNHWKSLPPKAEAEAELARLGIGDGKAAATGPGGDTLGFRLDGKAPHGSRFELTPTASGFDFRWDRITLSDDVDPERKTRAPRIELWLEQGEKKLPLVTVRPHTSYEEMQMAADMDVPYLTGSIEAHWDPSGRRVAISFSESMHGQHEEYGSVGRSATYLRALGPQVKLIDAGAGQQATRAAAANLESGGLVITAIDSAQKPEQGRTLYYRGERGGAAAAVAGKLLEGTTREELTAAGWLDLIIVMGAPAAAGTTPGSCTFVPFDLEAHAPKRVSQARADELLASLEKEYEEEAGGIGTLGPVVEHGKGLAYLFVECDGSECAGKIAVNGKEIVVPDFVDGVDGSVDFAGLFFADIDGDKKEEAIVQWSNMSFGEDVGAGLSDQNKLAIVDLARSKVQLVHDAGDCSPIELEISSASCPGGTQFALSCGGKRKIY